MSSHKTYPLLLLVLPLLIVCSPITSARRVLKGGCLNYGHSCLGAHGKRASWSLDDPQAAPTSKPILLSMLLDAALNTHPKSIASLTLPHEGDSSQGTDPYHRAIRYSNGRIINSPTTNEDEDTLTGDIMSDALLGILGSRMNGRDVRTVDGMDDDNDRDAMYFVNMEEYADDRVRRSAVEKARTTKDDQKGTSDDWEEGKESRNLHKGNRDNSKLRYLGNWVRR